MTSGVKQYTKKEAILVTAAYNRGYKKGYDEIYRLRKQIEILHNRIKQIEIICPKSKSIVASSIQRVPTLGNS